MQGAVTQFSIRRIAYMLLPPLFCSALAVATLNLGYLVFHVLAELFSIIISFTVLAVATAGRSFNRNHFVVFVAAIVAWAAGIDLIHTLTYQGMTLLPIEGSNTAIQLWLLARFIQALGLLLAPGFLDSPISMGKVHLMLAVYTGVGLGLMHLGWFPVSYIKGQGLTPFKIYSEYFIISLLILAAVRLWKYRTQMASELWWGSLAAILATTASEFAFTQYVSAYAPANMVGHVLKIFAFWFIFMALVETSLSKPFEALTQVASSYDAIPYPVLTVRLDGSIVQANQSAGTWVGLPQEQLHGQSSHLLFHDLHVDAQVCPVCKGLNTQTHRLVQRIAVKHGTHELECSLSRLAELGDPVFLQVICDVSAKNKTHTTASNLQSPIAPAP